MGEKIEDQKILENILSNAKYLRMALCNDNMPYIASMAFGYKNDAIYLHSSSKGMKIDALKNNSNVCFEVDDYHRMASADENGSYELKYRSVVGFGTATIVETEEEMKEGFRAIAEHYNKKTRDLDEIDFEKVAVIRIDIDNLRGTEHVISVHEE